MPDPQVDHLMTILRKFESIVFDLASSPSPLDGEYGHCVLCFAGVMGPDLVRPDQHYSTCPYRRAVEIVEGGVS